MNIKDLHDAWHQEFDSEILDEIDHEDDWNALVGNWLASQGCTNDEIKNLLATDDDFKFKL